MTERPHQPNKLTTATGRTLCGPALLLVLATGLCGCGDNATPAPSSPVTTVESLSAESLQAETPPAETAPVETLPDEPQVLIPLVGRKTWQEMDDPRRDGWTTEALAAEASTQLKLLGKLLANTAKINDTSMTSLLTDRFSCQALMPDDLHTAVDDKVYRVVRAAEGKGREPSDEDPFRGAAGMTDALRSLARPYVEADQIAIKFKIYHIELTDVGFNTHQYITITGRTKAGMIETHATWIAQWTKHTQRVLPRIHWIGVNTYEMTETKHGNSQLLTDCAESILKNTACYQEQLRRGLNYWIERCQQTRYAYILGTAGIAVGDVNGDGLDDLYLCQPEGIPNRLFLQQSDGTVEEVSEAWGVDWTNDSRGVLLFDWDNDGDQDLAVATLGGIVLASNDQQRRFRFETTHPTDDDTMSLTAADHDQDGDLDLFACVYSGPHVGEEAASGTPGASANFVYHDANDGGRNAFFLNDGTGRFKEATAEVGLDTNNHRFSLSAAWEDYDNDGDVDLYVANDYGRDNLYENQDGKFVDVADRAKVENSASGMSIAWADFDRNGFMDAYVSNMFSSAGSRITSQKRFKSDATPEVRRRLQRFTRGNTLLKNSGDASFDDISRSANVEMGRWAWGSTFVDLNNDGWQDLVVANGYVTADDNGDL